MAVFRDCVDIKCNWEKFDDVTEIRAKRGKWFGKVKWYYDGHFHGYSVQGADSDTRDGSADHLLIGFLDENLGISLIQISKDPRNAPKLYRGALKPDGSFEGDFYAVTSDKIIIQDIFSGQSIDFNKVQYHRIGRGKLLLGCGSMDYVENSFIEYLDTIGKVGLESEFASGIYNRASTPESLEEFKNDLQENVYPYENGESYGYGK